MVNSAAAALVSAAAIAAILGVHSAAVGSEVRIAGEAADMISSLATASNEALSASYDAPSRSITVRNHGALPARIFMVDVMAAPAGGGGSGGGAPVRVVLAPGGYAAPPGMIVVNGSVSGASREVAPGAAASIPLAGALAAAAPASSTTPYQHPHSAAITTDAGTRAVAAGLPVSAALRPAPPGGTGTGAGNGTATINGMGINSRIVHAWHGGFAVEGTGTVGSVLVPAGPYVRTGGTADDFVGVVLGGDPSEAAAVPSLSGSYAYGRGGSLAPDGGGGGAAAAAPLSYAAKRTLEGSPSVVRGGDGLQLRGPGRVVLELRAGDPGSALFLSGSASGAAEVLAGASPYDLAALAYAAGRGFEVWRGQAAAPSSHARFDAPCHAPSDRAEFSASYWWDVPSVPVGLRGRVAHGAMLSANNNLPDPATGRMGEPLMPAAARIEYGQGGGGGLYGTVEGLSMRSGGAPQLNGPAACHARPAGVVPILYDEAPVAEALAVAPGDAAHGRFEAVLAAPGAGGERSYVLVHMDGPSDAVSLSARQLSPGEALLSVGGLPPSIPYRIASGGIPLAAGVTSAAGGIALAAADMGLGPGARPAASGCDPAANQACAASGPERAPSAMAPGAVLHLYRDSFAVRGGLDEAVAYDPANNASFAVPSWRADMVYVVHAWARIPVVGHVSVSGAALNGTLPLPFVDGERGAGTGGGPAVPEYVHVPVVPRYAHVAMHVNGVPAALAFADAASAGGGGGGASSVRILLPSSSRTQAADPGGPVARAAAQAGAPLAYVAPRDGTLGAIFAVQASGSARTDNTYVLRGAGGDPGWRFNATTAVPGQAPPAGWQPGEPLSAHVVVRVNGDVSGTVRLASAAAPGGAAQDGRAAAYSASAGAGSVLVSASHGPLAYDARGSAAVPVRAGDLVEFEVVAGASAVAPPYAPPAGAEVSRSTGSASAAAAILSGTAIAGM